MTSRSADSEIVALDDVDAVRARPEMYVAPLSDPLLPNILLREAL